MLCNSVISNPHGVALRHRKYCSKICQADAIRGKPLSANHRRKLSDARKNSRKCRGPMLYNWKGGKATLNDRMRLHSHKRTEGVTVSLDGAFLERLRFVQADECFYCCESLKEYAAVEHLTPISRGGDNHSHNVVWSCRSCNSKKRHRTLPEFARLMNRPDWLTKHQSLHRIASQILKEKEFRESEANY